MNQQRSQIHNASRQGAPQGGNRTFLISGNTTSELWTNIDVEAFLKCRGLGQLDGMVASHLVGPFDAANFRLRTCDIAGSAVPPARRLRWNPRPLPSTWPSAFSRFTMSSPG